VNLLDTNVCVEILRRRSSRILARINDVGVERVAVSSITAGELYAGALKSAHVPENMAATQLLLSALSIISFDAEAARTYGLVRSQLEKNGGKIGELDTMIAAHAIALDAVLVTSNTKEFSRVQYLAVEDWTQ
jgi:tRNA(fMet)-specific endonuclease VapC